MQGTPTPQLAVYAFRTLNFDHFSRELSRENPFFLLVAEGRLAKLAVNEELHNWLLRQVLVPPNRRLARHSAPITIVAWEISSWRNEVEGKESWMDVERRTGKTEGEGDNGADSEVVETGKLS